MNIKEHLKYIYKIQKELAALSGTVALLDWDQKTYMPAGGAQARSEQISILSRMVHDKFVSKKFKNSARFLYSKKIFSKLNEKDKIVVKRLCEDIKKSEKLPSEFVEELTRTTSIASGVWEKAKKENNFKLFEPHLKKIIGLKKKESKFYGMAGHPYNGLLDDFEEGMTVEKLKKTFEYLRPKLVELLKKVRASKKYKARGRFKLKIDLCRQKQMGETVAKILNFPFGKARIDEAVHPFTTSIGWNDTRITTAFKLDHPLSAFFSTVHETGHAFYELGYPLKYKDTVIFSSPSLGAHESQSRFWENMIFHGKEFWKYFFPIAKKRLGLRMNFSQWYDYINQVKSSLIRVEADELTYCLHIILRFEIEMGLLDGTIKVEELPKAWNKKMKELFGIAPKKDRDGVLQDVHWSDGLIGYFPTYALGTIYASQLYFRMIKERPRILKEIEKGKLKNILLWLREKVHKYGRTLTAEEIIKKACGEGLNPEVYIDYLTKKYRKLYDL